MGASSVQTFFRIILPLLKPILLFVMVTSLVGGGVQMFDIPTIFTGGSGGPKQSAMTIMMYISDLLSISKQYGLAGAVSTVLFVITASISLTFFYFFNRDEFQRRRWLKMRKGKIDLILQRILIYVTLSLLVSIIIFLFYIMIVNASRPHADIQKRIRHLV